MRASISKHLGRLLLVSFLLLGGKATAENPAGSASRSVSKLLPNVATVQFAGNIGVVSFGPGWSYGSRSQSETQLLLGYLPKEVMFKDYFCLTVKQCYIPWQLNLNDENQLNPLVLHCAANTLFSGEFWYKEPDENYYNVSTKLRFHAGVGSRYNINLPPARQPHRDARRLTVYYELSTYDLAILSYVRNRSIHFADLFTLGIGFQYKLF